MPRKKCKRIVDFIPKVSGFKPFGDEKTNCAIELHFEEYETLRLLDYLGLSQEEAAEKMSVSRPTVTRIYEQARKKIAIGFVEGRSIEIKGGNYAFSNRWKKCDSCDFMYNSNTSDSVKCKCKETFSK